MTKSTERHEWQWVTPNAVLLIKLVVRALGSVSLDHHNMFCREGNVWCTLLLHTMIERKYFTAWVHFERLGFLMKQALEEFNKLMLLIDFIGTRMKWLVLLKTNFVLFKQIQSALLSMHDLAPREVHSNIRDYELISTVLFVISLFVSCL